MMMNLGEILAKLDGEDQISFLRFVGCTIGVKEDEMDAIENAAKNAAEIKAKLEAKGLISEELVKKYNEGIKKAFPDAFKDDEECSQKDKPNS